MKRLAFCDLVKHMFKIDQPKDKICTNDIISVHMQTLSLKYVAQKFQGTLSGLRQFWAIEIPLKMMKNAFYFTSKALFILKIFKFLS